MVQSSALGVPGWAQPHWAAPLHTLHLCLLFSLPFCPSAKALIGIFQILSLPPKEILLSFLFTKGNLDIFT